MALTASELEVRVTSDTAAAQKGLQGLGGQVQNTGGFLKTAAAQALGFVAAFGGIYAIRGVFNTFIGNAIEFEKAMLNVNSIAKLSDEQFQAMQQSVIDLSRELPQSASTLASGLYDISSSGFQGKDALQVLDAAARAASAGLTTTEVSAAGLTAVLNSYGASANEAQRYSDVMFKVVDRGVITFEELSSEIGSVASLASPLGVSFEEVGAAMAIMTRNGVNAAESATSIEAVMRNLLKPSQEAKELAADLGLEWDTAALKSKGLVGVLQDMIEKTGGSHEQMGVLLGDARAIRGAMVLAAGGTEEFENELALMQDSAGATATALSYQEKGLGFQLGILKNNVVAAGLAIGGQLIPQITPLVSGLSDWVANNQDVIEGIGTLVGGALASFIERVRLVADLVMPALTAAFREVSDWVQQYGPTVGRIMEQAMDSIRRVVDALAPVLERMAMTVLPLLGDALGAVATLIADNWPAVEVIMAGVAGVMAGMFTANLVNNVINFGTQMVATAAKIIPAATSMGASITLALGPVGIAIAAVVAAVAALWLAWESNFLGIQDIAASVATALGVAFEWIVAAVQTVGTALGQFITDVINVGTTVVQTIVGIPGAIADAITNIVNAIVGLGQQVVDATVAAWTEFSSKPGYYLGLALGAVIGGVAKIVATIVQFGAQVVATVVQFFSQLPGRAAQFFSAVWTNVSNWMSKAASTAATWASTLVSRVAGFISALPGRIAAFLSSLWSNVVSWFGRMAASAGTGASNIVSTVVRWISQLPGKVISFVGRIATDMIAFFRGLPGRLWYHLVRAGQAIVNGLWQGIQNLASWLWRQVSGFVSGIVDGVLGMFGISSPSKVFADIGEQLMRGLGEGVNRNATRAVGAMEDAMHRMAQVGADLPDMAMHGTVTRTLVGEAAALRLAPAARPAPVALGGSGVTVHLHADRFVGEQDEARYYTELISREVRTRLHD